MSRMFSAIRMSEIII